MNIGNNLFFITYYPPEEILPIEIVNSLGFLWKPRIFLLILHRRNYLLARDLDSSKTEKRLEPSQDAYIEIFIKSIPYR